jgi:plastocyanin
MTSPLAWVRGVCSILLVGVALASAPSLEVSGEPRIHEIIIDKLTFSPQSLAVSAGDTVRWVNKDIFVHSATADDGSFDLELPVGQSADLVVKQGGSIAYHCRYHPGMSGHLDVSPQSAEAEDGK